MDNDGLKRLFLKFIKAFTKDINFCFLNYNKFIKENRKKIDVQVKASKKEKKAYLICLAQEELAFWKGFPRKRKFYSTHLRAIKNAFDTPETI